MYLFCMVSEPQGVQALLLVGGGGLKCDLGVNSSNMATGLLGEHGLRLELTKSPHLTLALLWWVERNLDGTLDYGWWWTVPGSLSEVYDITLGIIVASNSKKQHPVWPP